MAKRKSEDNPATSDGDAKKRQRMSEDPFAKKVKKAKKDKKYNKTREEPVVEEDVVDLAMTDLDNGKIEQQQTKKDEQEEPAAENGVAGNDENKSKKKRKKNKKAAKEDDGEKATNADGEGAENDETAAAAVAGSNEGGENNKRQSAKKSRFIVFVGNLPYSATAEDVERHFTAVQPTAIRLLHEKTNPNKSRGIAFLEFAGYDRMKTCLKTMHHTTLKCQGRDHRGRPKLEERVINVELTAGGGGNTEGRREKIKAKNEKLNDERHRRALEEEKQKVKKEQERLLKEGEKKGGADGIHPSRRGRVPGGRR
ncbi:hypothetical protein PFICI_02284 [Pestalotiopsis fici W106-1]|uniref:RRM domain-containing protein n=1 Tax=Pestalotiopsis fici (strain W106-1 / CGMCC3.15140) TaxID=1229662 RepID=W3XE29_PESFW|nr:uncharacterized protein PFICI_02284 [Pestalotiopsis fici W106-1]ETS84259.1 hypothetical protein PFICI_02284 [Pestalotiopsis fici W106-1]